MKGTELDFSHIAPSLKDKGIKALTSMLFFTLSSRRKVFNKLGFRLNVRMDEKKEEGKKIKTRWKIKFCDLYWRVTDARMVN